MNSFMSVPEWDRPTLLSKDIPRGARDDVLFYQVKHASELQNKDVLFIYYLLAIFVKYLLFFYFLFSDFFVISWRKLDKVSGGQVKTSVGEPRIHTALSLVGDLSYCAEMCWNC